MHPVVVGDIYSSTQAKYKNPSSAWVWEFSIGWLASVPDHQNVPLMWVDIPSDPFGHLHVLFEDPR
jgi:hypothetical protein